MVSRQQQHTHVLCALDTSPSQDTMTSSASQACAEQDTKADTTCPGYVVRGGERQRRKGVSVCVVCVCCGGRGRGGEGKGGRDDTL